MQKPQSRLGRGLQTLVSARPAPAAPPGVNAVAAADVPSAGLLSLPIGSITANPQQPRSTFDDATLQELAESIRANGVLQPVLVRQTGAGQWELVAGERRLRAAKLAGLTEVPAVARELSDAQSFELAIVENVQRQDLHPLERARAYQHYLERFGGTVENLAGRLGESRANVSNYLRILKLQPEIVDMLSVGELAMGQARALAGVDNPQRQLALARLAVRRNLSVRQVEELVKQAAEDAVSRETHVREKDDSDGQRRHFSDIADAFSRCLGVSVTLKSGKRKNSGRIVITYNSLEDFDRIAQKLGADLHTS